MKEQEQNVVKVNADQNQTPNEIIAQHNTENQNNGEQAQQIQESLSNVQTIFAEN